MFIACSGVLYQYLPERCDVSRCATRTSCASCANTEVSAQATHSGAHSRLTAGHTVMLTSVLLRIHVGLFVVSIYPIMCGKPSRGSVQDLYRVSLQRFELCVFGV